MWSCVHQANECFVYDESMKNEISKQAFLSFYSERCYNMKGHRRVPNLYLNCFLVFNLVSTTIKMINFFHHSGVRLLFKYHTTFFVVNFSVPIFWMNFVFLFKINGKLFRIQKMSWKRFGSGVESAKNTMEWSRKKHGIKTQLFSMSKNAHSKRMKRKQTGFLLWRFCERKMTKMVQIYFVWWQQIQKIWKTTCFIQYSNSNDRQ